VMAHLRSVTLEHRGAQSGTTSVRVFAAARSRSVAWRWS
jgi:hypothetical protein